MKDFDFIKTSLYMTELVVLRNEGDTVIFWGHEITKTRRGFEVKNSTDLVEPLLNFKGWKTRNRLHIQADSDGARDSKSFGYQTCNYSFNNYPHKSSIPQKKASEQ